MATRLVVAFLALQVLSGWLILFAIVWCLREIWRHPDWTAATRRRAAQPVSVWYDLEVASSRRRTAGFRAEHVGARAAA